MVWGVLPPSGSGDYGPYGTKRFKYKGEYIEEDDLHRAYFEEHLSNLKEPGPWEAADGRNVLPISKYVSWARKKSFVDHGPVLDHEWPVEFQMQKKPKNLASLAAGSLYKMVDGDLKNLIEEFEPGVHQFSPVDLLLPDGTKYPVQYYTFVIRRYIRSFVPEESVYVRYFQGNDKPFDGSGRYRIDDTKKALSQVALSREKIGGAHIWYETDVTQIDFCISDEFQAAVQEKGLRFWRHYRMREV